MIVFIVRHEFRDLFRELGSEACPDSEKRGRNGLSAAFFFGNSCCMSTDLEEEQGTVLISSRFSDTCSGKKQKKLR